MVDKRGNQGPDGLFFFYCDVGLLFPLCPLFAPEAPHTLWPRSSPSCRGSQDSHAPRPLAFISFYFSRRSRPPWMRATAKRPVCNCKRWACPHVGPARHGGPLRRQRRLRREADWTRWKQAAIIISHSAPLEETFSVWRFVPKFKGNLCDLLAFTSA